MLNRLQFLFLMATVGALAGFAPTRNGAKTAGIQFGSGKPFNFHELKLRAKAMAAMPYQEPVIRHGEILETIDYDAFQQIVFKREHGWGEDGSVNFPVQLFHLARYFKVSVKFHALLRGKAPVNLHLFLKLGDPILTETCLALLISAFYLWLVGNENHMYNGAGLQ